jgi:phosphoglycerol transferase MdoB-like AlkP superfamily enzyme
MIVFLKKNWFQLVVIALLILCYVRLGEIEKNAFYTADMVDSSTTRVINSTESYLNKIQRNTENTWQILDNHY